MNKSTSTADPAPPPAPPPAVDVPSTSTVDTPPATTTAPVSKKPPEAAKQEPRVAGENEYPKMLYFEGVSTNHVIVHSVVEEDAKFDEGFETTIEG